MEDSDEKKVRLELEAKQNELEDLQAAATKTRNDFLRRQEQLKKESEDKVHFLLQQLRAAENKAAASVRNSNNPLMSSGFLVNASKNFPSTPPRPPSTSSTARTIPSERKLSDQRLSGELQVFMQQYNNEFGKHSNNSTPIRTDRSGKDTEGGDGQTDEAGAERLVRSHQEVLRRWHSEKERREQLEKRNSELCKELRGLRGQNSNK